MRLLPLMVSGLLLISAPSGAETIRLMTWNAQWLVSSVGEAAKAPWRDEAEIDAHHDRLARVIAREDADVVNLVEVVGRRSLEELAEKVNALAPAGGPYRAYGATCHDHGTRQCLGVLTRRPLEAVDGQAVRHFYSAEEDGRWRQPAGPGETTSLSKNIVYAVRVGGRKLGLVGLHLAAFPADTRRTPQREGQAEVAARILAEEVAGRGLVPVVLGDLNDFDPDVPDLDDRAQPITTVLRRIKDYDPAQPGDELVNAAAGLPKQERWTYRHRGSATQIDHVLVHRSLADSVTRVEIPRAVEGASDHWPMVVELDIPDAVAAAR